MPPFMELEGKVVKMLSAVDSYRIEGDRLTPLAGDQILARFDVANSR